MLTCDQFAFRRESDKDFFKNHEDISKLTDQLQLPDIEFESVSFLT